jgi:branched-chain amino acid transport system substrate-binding protein
MSRLAPNRPHRQRIIALGLAALLAGLGTASSAWSQETLKIGVLSTLSGQSAVLGQHMRDGFALAAKQLGGKLGGVPTEILVVDDELKPDVAVTKVKAMVERDNVQFVVGPIFSNVLAAIYRPVTESKTFLISPNAGPSSFAGKACSPYFMVTSYQNDQNHEVLGKVAQDRNLKRVVLLVPNYQAGKDSVAGFKRHFKGEIVDEVYVPLGQLDFAAELAKLASQKPDAVFTFMPGGMGVNLVKQFRQAGLADQMVFLSAFTVDEATLPAQQDAAIGLFGGSNWAPDLDTALNKAFVAAFEKEYGYVPASYAMHAYDAAMMIDAAVKKTGGKVSDKEALQAALKTADFASLRGSFKLGNNGFPIQDFYLVKVAKRADGKFQTQVDSKVFTQAVDSYAKDCALN